MKRILHILQRLVLVAVVAASVSSCYLTKIKDLDISSFGIKYVVPSSVNALSGVLLLGVDNPSISFTVTSLDGVIMCDGQPLVYVDAGEVPVQRRSIQVYEVPCTVTLAVGVSYLDVLVKVSRRTPSLAGFTANANLHVKLKNGKGTTLTFKDLDLSQFTQ